jgi:hypothetical protein
MACYFMKKKSLVSAVSAQAAAEIRSCRLVAPLENALQQPRETCRSSHFNIARLVTGHVVGLVRGDKP